MVGSVSLDHTFAPAAYRGGQQRHACNPARSRKTPPNSAVRETLGSPRATACEMRSWRRFGSIRDSRATRSIASVIRADLTVDIILPRRGETRAELRAINAGIGASGRQASAKTPAVVAALCIAAPKARSAAMAACNSMQKNSTSSPIKQTPAAVICARGTDRCRRIAHQPSTQPIVNETIGKPRNKMVSLGLIVRFLARRRRGAAAAKGCK